MLSQSQSHENKTIPCLFSPLLSSLEWELRKSHLNSTNPDSNDLPPPRPSQNQPLLWRTELSTKLREVLQWPEKALNWIYKYTVLNGCLNMVSQWEIWMLQRSFGPFNKKKSLVKLRKVSLTAHVKNREQRERGRRKLVQDKVNQLKRIVLLGIVQSQEGFTTEKMFQMTLQPVKC